MQEAQEKKIEEIFRRGTIVEILPDRDSFRKKLLSEKLRFYIGFDATAPTLHLSHAKNIMLLEKFRKLGHEVIILFGDFTARIGDPTGEKSTRKQLSREEVLQNVASWQRLIKPLMDFDAKENPPIIKMNHDWLSKLTFEDIIHLASNFTVQQMLERDMFEKRMVAREPVYLHEFLYPLMQGYDSVAMDVDVELCGTDQTFNALAGRTLLKKLKNKEKFVVTVTLMENPKSGELMSKSKGTGVFLDTTANEKFGQIMAQPDEMTKILFVNCTLLSLSEIDQIMKMENPRDSKMELAKEIVALYHGKQASVEAEHYFITTFSEGKIPDVVRSVSTEVGTSILDVMVKAGVAESKGSARRKIEQGGVEIEGKRVTSWALTLEREHDGVIVKVGKKDFFQVAF